MLDLYRSNERTTLTEQGKDTNFTLKIKKILEPSKSSYIRSTNNLMKLLK